MLPRHQELWGVILDWGGIVRSLEDERMLSDLARTCGVSRNVIDELWNAFDPDFLRGKRTEDDFWKLYTKSTGRIPPPALKDLFICAYRDFSKPNLAVHDIIQRLRSNGYRVGLLSNVEPPHFAYFREHPAWSKYDQFDFVIASCEAGVKKGDPGNRIYQIAEDRMQRPNILFCDDRPQYAIKAIAELNERRGAPAHWVGVHAPDFENVAHVLEKVLKKEGFKLS